MIVSNHGDITPILDQQFGVQPVMIVGLVVPRQKCNDSIGYEEF